MIGGKIAQGITQGTDLGLGLNLGRQIGKGEKLGHPLLVVNLLVHQIGKLLLTREHLTAVVVALVEVDEPAEGVRPVVPQGVDEEAHGVQADIVRRVAHLIDHSGHLILEGLDLGVQISALGLECGYG